MDIFIIGIDLGKNSCSLAGLDTSGRVVLRRRMRRSSVASFVKGLGRCIMALEACCGAHHLGRLFAAQGHEVRLMLKIRGPNGVCSMSALRPLTRSSSGWRGTTRPCGA
jgi:transposase